MQKKKQRSFDKTLHVRLTDTITLFRSRNNFLSLLIGCKKGMDL